MGNWNEENVSLDGGGHSDTPLLKEGSLVTRNMNGTSSRNGSEESEEDTDVLRMK